MSVCKQTILAAGGGAEESHDPCDTPMDTPTAYAVHRSSRAHEIAISSHIHEWEMPVCLRCVDVAMALAAASGSLADGAEADGPDGHECTA